MLLSNKGDSWLKWTLILGSSSTTVWKEKIKAQKQLANSDITVFFFLKIYIYIYIDTHTYIYIYIYIHTHTYIYFGVRKYQESSRDYVFEG